MEPVERPVSECTGKKKQQQQQQPKKKKGKFYKPQEKCLGKVYEENMLYGSFLI